MNLAIIGMGPFGLCVLETLLRALAERLASQSGEDFIVYVIEPNEAGVGVHRTDLPDYMLLNTICGQLDLFCGRRGTANGHGATFGFFEWLRCEGYRVDPEGCVSVDGAGRLVSPDDFVSRCVFGRYLGWVYEILVAHAPAHVQIIHHRGSAVAIRRRGDREIVLTESGHEIVADHVFLTVGHIASNRRIGASDRYRRPYSLDELSRSAQPGRPVAIAGLGLVAIDVLMALTVGRGGRFTAGPEDALSYQPSGREPDIYLYSRSGLPFLCRPASTLDSTGAYEPVIFTSREVQRLSSVGPVGVDFRADVLPLIFAEMIVHFYSSHEQLVCHGGYRHSAVRLARAWKAGTFEECLRPYREAFGVFNPRSILFGDHDHAFTTSGEYQRLFTDALQTDLVESRKGERLSPLKGAVELFRVLRDNIRAVVEADSLHRSSYEDFFDKVASMINRIVVGPPLQRGAEFLALVEAGVVRVPFGPSPRVRHDGAGGWTIASTALEVPMKLHVDEIVMGYLETSPIDRSDSPLLRQLFDEGRIRPSYRRFGGCGIDVDAVGQPRNSKGCLEYNITALGPLTEGSRYFTYYVPSPKSRARAFDDAANAVKRILDRATADRGAELVGFVGPLAGPR